MAWPPWVLGVIRAFRGRAVLVLYLPPPEGESETRRRAQRLEAQPVRAGRRPPRSGALEEASTSPTLNRLPGRLFGGHARHEPAASAARGSQSEAGVGRGRTCALVGRPWFATRGDSAASGGIAGFASSPGLLPSEVAARFNSCAGTR